MKPYELADEELDNIGYPILPIGDRTGHKRVAHEAQKKLIEFIIKECPVLNPEIQDYLIDLLNAFGDIRK